jgi:hypothetical protein
MARKKAVVPQLFVVGNTYDTLVTDDTFPTAEDAAQSAVDYEGDPSYVDGYTVYRLVPVARIVVPSDPQFTLETIN